MQTQTEGFSFVQSKMYQDNRSRDKLNKDIFYIPGTITSLWFAESRPIYRLGGLVIYHFQFPEEMKNYPVFLYLQTWYRKQLRPTLFKINGTIIQWCHWTLRKSTFCSLFPPVFNCSSPLRFKWPHVSFVSSFVVNFSIHPPVIGGAWFETSRKVIYITIVGDFLAVLGWRRCCFGDCRLVRAKIHAMCGGTEGV